MFFRKRSLFHSGLVALGDDLSLLQNCIIVSFTAQCSQGPEDAVLTAVSVMHYHYLWCLGECQFAYNALALIALAARMNTIVLCSYAWASYSSMISEVHPDKCVLHGCCWGAGCQAALQVLGFHLGILWRVLEFLRFLLLDGFDLHTLGERSDVALCAHGLNGKH